MTSTRSQGSPFIERLLSFQASHIYERLALARPELRLRDLMTVFKSWKEAIGNAEKIHQKEENKLRLSTDHPESYYMTDAVLQAGTRYDFCRQESAERIEIRVATVHREVQSVSTCRVAAHEGYSTRERKLWRGEKFRLRHANAPLRERRNNLQTERLRRL